MTAHDLYTRTLSDYKSWFFVKFGGTSSIVNK